MIKFDVLLCGYKPYGRVPVKIFVLPTDGKPQEPFFILAPLATKLGYKEAVVIRRIQNKARNLQQFIL